MAKVVFLSLVVCLLATLWGNASMDFHEIFKIDQTWYKKQSGFWGCSIFLIFSLLWGEGIHISWQHYRKMGNWIFVIVKMVRMSPKEQCGTFWGCCVSLCRHRKRFLLFVSMFAGNIMEIWLNRFLLNFQDMLNMIQNIARLFHARLECLMVPQISTAKCLLPTLWKKDEFSG